MYKELVLSLRGDNEWVKPKPPCSEREIKRAEKIVGHPFPNELRALLCEMDGDNWCLWSAKEIIDNVKLNRESWLPFFEQDGEMGDYYEKVDRFVFFAGNGCGDYYGYRVRPDGSTDDTVIYIWEHECLSDECCWHPVASDMAELITRYYNDEI